MPTMLTVNNLGHYYEQDDWLFKDLTFSLNKGESLSVLGPNARGKTTFLQCVAGLIQPQKGEVTLGGAIGYVPQNHGNKFTYPVLDIVVMGRARLLKAYQSPSQQDMREAKEALDRVGMGAIMYKQFNHLSGGQQQLVLIARALASHPHIVVLDEPASALDLKNQSLVLHVVNTLLEQNITVMMTTHHPDHALYLGGKSLFLLPERNHQIGKTKELFTNKRLTHLYDTPVVVGAVPVSQSVRYIAVPDFAAAK